MTGKWLRMRGLCLFPSLGGRCGFVEKLKPSNLNMCHHKGESCSKLALGLLLLPRAQGWTRIIKKSCWWKEGKHWFMLLRLFLILDKRFGSFPLKARAFLSKETKPWLLSMWKCFLPCFSPGWVSWNWEASGFQSVRAPYAGEILKLLQSSLESMNGFPLTSVGARSTIMTRSFNCCGTEGRCFADSSWQPTSTMMYEDWFPPAFKWEWVAADPFRSGDARLVLRNYPFWLIMIFEQKASFWSLIRSCKNISLNSV